MRSIEVTLPEKSSTDAANHVKLRISSKKKRKMASWDESEGLTDKFRLLANITYFSCLILNWKMASLFLRCETSKMVFLSGYCMGMTKVKKMEECEEEVMV